MRSTGRQPLDAALAPETAAKPGSMSRAMLARRRQSLAHLIGERIAQVVIGVIARVDALDDLRRRAFENLEVWLRRQADPQRPGDQRREHGDFAPGEVLQ